MMWWVEYHINMIPSSSVVHRYLSGSGEHVDPECRGGPGRVLDGGPDLGLVLVLAVSHAEHVHSVCGPSSPGRSTPAERK